RPISRQVKNMFLAAFHTRDILIEANEGRAFGAVKPTGLQNILFRCNRLAEPFLEYRAKILPECGIVRRILFRTLFQLSKNTLDDGILYAIEERVLLQRFAADIKGQILGIDNTAQKPQIVRDKVSAFVGDEHAPDIELDASFAVGVKEIERLNGRNEQKVC